MNFIKKIICIFILFLLIINTTFAYELESYNKNKGYNYLFFGKTKQGENEEIEPILWRVLEVDEEKAYLLSEFILFNNRIHSDEGEWNESGAKFNITEIYDILNNVFFNKAFTEEEQKMIIDSEELGKIFLVTADDIKNINYGFKNNDSRKAFGTPYALKNGLFQYIKSFGNHSPYWTRSQSSTMKYGARCTKQDGSVGYSQVIDPDKGIRPALYLDITKYEIKDGEGTLENPFIINQKNSND